MTECKHDWERGTDWMGDPDVINGTMSWTFWHCRKCDEHVTECPDDYEEVDPDYERDMRMEDREWFEKYAED